nr:ABC transporter G family member 22-like isoform X2 [Ipomoea batatas]
MTSAKVRLKSGMGVSTQVGGSPRGVLITQSPLGMRVEWQCLVAGFRASIELGYPSIDHVDWLEQRASSKLARFLAWGLRIRWIGLIFQPDSRRARRDFGEIEESARRMRSLVELDCVISTEEKDILNGISGRCSRPWGSSGIDGPSGSGKTTFLSLGFSGEERNRVCIGNEIIINPSLLFPEEPTSGLDSTTALKMVEILQDIAEVGEMMITMIHQPSSRLFHKFDKLILLGKGSLLYFGKTFVALDYFSSIGCVPLIAMNPAEFLLDLANRNVNDVSVPSKLEDKV